MSYDPVKYRSYERDPLGCFEAEMTTNGWVNTKFDHDLQEHLLSDEVGEFIRFVHSFFKQCPSWRELQNYSGKHGTAIRNDEGTPEYFINFSGDRLDYTFQVSNTQLNIFPYRKYKH